MDIISNWVTNESWFPIELQNLFPLLKATDSPGYRWMFPILWFSSSLSPTELHWEQGAVKESIFSLLLAIHVKIACRSSWHAWFAFVDRKALSRARAQKSDGNSRSWRDRCRGSIERTLKNRAVHHHPSRRATAKLAWQDRARGGRKWAPIQN